MKEIVSSLLALLVFIHTGASLAQTTLWQDVTPRAKSSVNTSGVRYFDSNGQALRDLLNRVPGELSGQSATIDLPMPDGSLSSFKIIESPIMEAELAAKYSQIKTYKVYGIDDPVASGRVDITDQGFHAMLQTSQGRLFIDPDTSSLNANRYLARTRHAKQTSEPFICSAGELVENHSSEPILASRVSNRVPGALLTYRLAVSTTREYALFSGGTPGSTLGAITTAINRVNQIFELDHGIRLVLVANNDSLIDLAGTSPLAGSNNDGLALLSVNKTWIDSKIGANAYDIGHVFSTGGGGIARISSVCDGLLKAEGVTGLSNPVGDPFYIDFVAHEIGHQFGADHSFNGTTSNCSGASRNQVTAMEPGSGSTIMAYAGICGAEDIQPNSDATFHAKSIEQINSFVTSGGGASCNVLFSVANNDPTANAGADRNIPASTPFQLAGSGTDSNGDTISFQWDQMDAGTSTNSATLGQDFGDNALFRTFVPQCTAERDFPALINQILGTPDTAEALPTTTRTLNFRLTVRDSKTGQATDDVLLSVDGGSGPFAITSHTAPATIAESDTPTVTWNVAGTNGPPVNCPNVDIDLLTFSANHDSYSVTNLVSNTPNDGSEVLPATSGERNAMARFRVKCSDNIFYDISDADLNFTGTGLPYPTSQFNTRFTTTNTCNSGTLNVGGQIGGGGGGGGGGSFVGPGRNLPDTLWLIILSSLFLGVSFKRAGLSR